MNTNLDPATQAAEEAKDRAIAQVAFNNGNDLLKILSFAFEWVKYRAEEFTTEDIKDAFFRANPDYYIREPRVWGAVMLFLKKQRLCVPTGAYKISNSKICHRGHKAVWKPINPLPMPQNGLSEEIKPIQSQTSLF